jgi:hypothetical protein
MKPGRIILAAILGGIVMFAWGATSHMALGLGDMGVTSIPEETEMLLAACGLGERGFYFFPGMPEGEMSEAQQKSWMDKYRAGPRGVLIYDPSGAEMMAPGQLITEFLSNALAALLAAIVLSRVAASRATRAFFGLLLGLLAWLSIDVSYWNWYRFPDLFTASQLIDQGVGWLLSGAAIALALGRSHWEVAAMPAASAARV